MLSRGKQGGSCLVRLGGLEVGGEVVLNERKESLVAGLGADAQAGTSGTPGLQAGAASEMRKDDVGQVHGLIEFPSIDKDKGRYLQHMKPVKL